MQRIISLKASMELICNTIRHASNHHMVFVKAMVFFWFLIKNHHKTIDFSNIWFWYGFDQFFQCISKIQSHHTFLKVCATINHLIFKQCTYFLYPIKYVTHNDNEANEVAWLYREIGPSE